MALSKLNVRRVDSPELGRALDEIVNTINQLIDEVNSVVTENRSGTRGDAGAIRVVDNKADGRIYIEGRTKKGWYGAELLEMEQ
jgi:hypothetical protein